MNKRITTLVTLCENSTAYDKRYKNINMNILTKGYNFYSYPSIILENPNDFSEHMRNFALFNLELI
jgi:Zn-dependent peptidase ImmA (M78 family)